MSSAQWPISGRMLFVYVVFMMVVRLGSGYRWSHSALALSVTPLAQVVRTRAVCQALRGIPQAAASCYIG